MSISDFFDGLCDIYFPIDTPRVIGYGVPNMNEVTYADVPDLPEVECHFHLGSDTLNINQSDPRNVMTRDQKLSLPIDTQIPLNSKVIDKSNNLEYMASVFMNVRNHHIVGEVYRNTNKGEI